MIHISDHRQTNVHDRSTGVRFRVDFNPAAAPLDHTAHQSQTQAFSDFGAVVTCERADIDVFFKTLLGHTTAIVGERKRDKVISTRRNEKRFKKGIYLFFEVSLLKVRSYPPSHAESRRVTPSHAESRRGYHYGNAHNGLRSGNCFK